MPPANQFINPVDAEERAEIIRLHGEGKGRNEIARIAGRALRTISLICAEEGLVFDPSATEAATRARVAQLAALRAETAMDLHLDGMRLTQQLWEPAKVYSFGGKDNTYAEKDVAEPPAVDKRNLMAAAGIAFEKSLKLAPPEREDTEGLAAVDSWLRGMLGGE
ncbi:helix-turn-helix domain-containing protein [Streptomyces adelaidensis]|uniref:helix-turn-helix domain-containing protein n=1 Tax=Streptomyces adelaidensis TaxID=2796465 RepID=UPI001F175DD4|nr:helix-turn-helix domain-containing protein [Streptomyces adelaidensis]